MADRLFFFFNDTATTEIYTLSLHDALPISAFAASPAANGSASSTAHGPTRTGTRLLAVVPSSLLFLGRDRKSTRLNSSHLVISYAVFCLKKKKKTTHLPTSTALIIT